MKIFNSLLITAIVSFSAIAGQNYLINSNPVDTHYCAEDMPAVFYLKGHKVNENVQVNLLDLHEDEGPEMHFRVELYGTQSPGNIFFFPLVPGDFSFTIPGRYVGEQTVLVIFDENRYVHGAGHQYVESPKWPAQKFSFEALQDIPEYPEIEIYTKDHHLGNPSIYVLAAKIKNIGTVPFSDFKIRYFFTAEDASNVVNLADYNSPNCSPTLLNVSGTNEYALELDYAGFTVNPGETSEGAIENQFHIWYNGYTPINKFNDYSNPVPQEIGHLPSSTLYAISNGTAVYAADGTLAAGSEKPGYTKGQYTQVR